MMEQSVASGLVEEAPGAVERYRFTHTLIQETLTDELSAARRMRMHARVGEALEELYGADVESHAAELAYHFGEAQAIAGPGKLVHHSRLAGKRAISSNAYEEALVHFLRALTAKEGSSSSTDVRRGVDAETATILFGLGRAQTATFAIAQAQESN